MKGNVLLIAVGGIGFRHFQALLNCKSDFDLHVVDVSNDAVQRARDYANDQKAKRAIHYYASVAEVPQGTGFQIAIIATSSLPRRAVFEGLTARCEVQSVIFEKVLFPRLEDYEAVGAILRAKHISAYVNCARRVSDFYMALREKTRRAKWIFAQARGSDWGLACNGIHMIDLVAYLSPTGIGDVACNGSLLENHIYDSKRKGYIEFYGRLTGKLGEKATYLMECSHGREPLVIELFTDTAYYCINESQGLMTVQDLDTGDLTVRHFQSLLVSQSTTRIVDRLLCGQAIELTGYQDSARLHVPLLREFLKKKNEIQGSESELCPIT